VIGLVLTAALATTLIAGTATDSAPSPPSSAAPAPGTPSPPSSSAPAPGTPAPPGVVAEIRQALNGALARFNAGDAAGVLAYVSDHYRTGGLTKAALAEQLQALYAVHDAVTARVRIDDVRMIGEQAWVYTTGEVVGRLRWVGGTIPVASWQREPEVAQRESGAWRLVGDGT
jgi:hypothetical protein